MNFKSNFNGSISLIPLFFLSIFTSCNGSTEKNDYKILSSGNKGDQLLKYVEVPKPISIDSAIELSRKIRVTSQNPDKLMCYFYLPGMSANFFCWASVEYTAFLSNAQDKDGTLVRFIALEPETVPKDKMLSLKTTENDLKNLVIEVPDFQKRRKYQIFNVVGEPNKAVYVILYLGYPQQYPLNIKTVNGVKTYVVADKRLKRVFLTVVDGNIFYHESSDDKLGKKLG